MTFAIFAKYALVSFRLMSFPCTPSPRLRQRLRRDPRHLVRFSSLRGRLSALMGLLAEGRREDKWRYAGGRVSEDHEHHLKGWTGSECCIQCLLKVLYLNSYALMYSLQALHKASHIEWSTCHQSAKLHQGHHQWIHHNHH